MRLPALLWLAYCCPLLAQDGSLGYTDLLGRLTDLSWLFRPGSQERCIRFSSYDRASDKGPSDPAAWYANGDHGQFLRTEERDGASRFVMADCEGPGFVARIWSANPKGRLVVEADGEEPFDVDFAEFTKGRLDGLGEPFCGEHGRGCTSYVPMPFAESLRISCTEKDIYYQVDVVRLPPGTRVPSFSPALLEANRSAMAETGQRIEAARSVPDPGAGAGPRRRVEIQGSRLVTSVVLSLRPAPGPGGAGGKALAPDRSAASRLRDDLLVVRCGGEETVRVPVLDFFAGGPAWRPHLGAWLGVAEDGTAYCRLPMPMPDGGVVEIESGPQSKVLGLCVGSEPRSFEEPPLLFRADWHLVKDDPTRPLHDHLVLDARGEGRLCGAALLVRNPVRAWWGEGDEKFTVDGEAFPSTFGTGTEDYFGYAWCCPVPFSAAFHAQAQCDGPGNYGYTAVNRVHVLDSVPFRRSFRFDLEVWHWADCRVDYASVAFWYGAKGARSGLPPLPPAEARRLAPMPPWTARRVEGAIEGEDLEVLSCTGGTHEVQELDDAKFSAGRQRWWKDGKPGDSMTLRLPVPHGGRFDVRMQFCTAVDYGIVQVVLDGQRLGPPIDLFHLGVLPSGEKDLGVVELPAGAVELELRLVGRNEHAVPRHMIGLDYVRLVKAREEP
ncbi:MAG: DUF2961 domain-containing protein [Planctomycetota bacterium]